MNSILFTEGKIGPLTLRNRTIRSAAFESMCPGNRPSQELFDYHLSVAAGGVGMTTIAYVAVTQSGLSFERQLWMRPEIVPELRRLTDAIHHEGAGQYPAWALWQHVSSQHLRLHARRCKQWIQPLFPHFCPWTAKE